MIRSKVVGIRNGSTEVSEKFARIVRGIACANLQTSPYRLAQAVLICLLTLRSCRTSAPLFFTATRQMPRIRRLSE